MVLAAGSDWLHRSAKIYGGAKVKVQLQQSVLSDVGGVSGDRKVLLYGHTGRAGWT